MFYKKLNLDYSDLLDCVTKFRNSNVDQWMNPSGQHDHFYIDITSDLYLTSTYSTLSSLIGNLKIRSFVFFKCSPGAKGNIHKDGSEITFNFPISSAVDGKQIWVIPETDIEPVLGGPTPAVYNTMPNYKEIETLILDKPAVCKVNEWHLVDNSKNINERNVIALRFWTDLSYNEMINKLRPIWSETQ